MLKRTIFTAVLCFALAMFCVAGQVRTDSMPDARFGDFARSFPDFPANHWAYEDLALLKREGLLQGYWEPVYRGPRFWGRYDLARMYFYAASKLLSRARQMHEMMTNISIELPTSSKASDLLENLRSEIADANAMLFKRALSALDRGLKFFQPEVNELGPTSKQCVSIVVEAKSLIASARVIEAGRALTQFPDVLANHWAAKDVLAMRRLGLLDGYEDSHGNFKFN